MYNHFSTVNMLLEKGANVTSMDLVSYNSLINIFLFTLFYDKVILCFIYSCTVPLHSNTIM